MLLIEDVVKELPEDTGKEVRACYRNTSKRISLYPEETVKQMINVFKILGNPVRLQILRMILEEEHCVCVMAALLKKDQTLISHHLRKMKNADLIEERIEGRFRFYRVKSEMVKKALKSVEMLE